MTIELAKDQEETSEEHGYDPRLVPLGGMRKVHPSFCRCEEHSMDDKNLPDCGCGFGQCAKGLIY